jgi:hypothetical protein
MSYTPAPNTFLIRENSFLKNSFVHKPEVASFIQPDKEDEVAMETMLEPFLSHFPSPSPLSLC